MNKDSFAKIKGFTLAEVLITLTIIGVIAAMTVPTLYTKYQKYTFVVGLKKAYATLQNAVKMIPLTEGCPAGDYVCAGLLEDNGKATDIDGKNFNGDARVKKAYLLSKHMKVDKFCDGDYGRGKSTCYRGETINDKNRQIYNILFYSPQAGFITQDGMIWVVSWSDDSTSSASRASNGVIVDVNGKKGPNIDGIDTFRFTIAGPEVNGVKAGTVMPSGSRQYLKYVYGTEQFNFTYCKPPEQITALCTGKVLEENAINY